MRTRQRGVTFIGWLFLLIPIAMVGYAGIRLTPEFLNHLKVVKAIEQTAEEFKGEDSISPQRVRNSLEKRFDIDTIYDPQARDVAVRRDGTSWVIEADYEKLVPLFANVSLLVQFNKASAIN